jgi:hypothetical protein
MSHAERQSAPATHRNREPILSVMRGVFPDRGFVLEVSSGTGEHAAFFSRSFPDLVWQPSDVDSTALASIESWRDEGSEGLLPPIELDTTAEPWPVEQADVVVNINMIHIAPWEACCGLMRGAGAILPSGGLLFMYGPYRIGNRHTAWSNEAFDESLRGRDPAWGVRDLETVIEEADAHELLFEECLEMPANNFSLIFRRA